MCTRPVITTITMRDGRSLDRCETCRQVGPVEDAGAWSADHHVEANDAQVRIESVRSA